MVAQHYRWDFIGLSTDTKPTPETSEKVTDGSTYYTSDDSKLYVWYKDQWYEKEVEGGGGTTYTAGDGIDITNSTISVDTDTIQPKLTAGTNITITDNVISASGGGSITPVQTTGTSTTDVMSQNATTTMLYNDPSTKYQIKIGGDTNVSGASTIAIGRSASSNNRGVSIGSFSNASGGYSVGGVAIGYATNNNVAVNADYTVALGAGAKATRQGEMNIGLSGESELLTKGFNNSEYRLISGVYDGQSSHDAVTVGQLNATIDAINSALNTSIPHVGA